MELRSALKRFQVLKAQWFSESWQRIWLEKWLFGAKFTDQPRIISSSITLILLLNSLIRSITFGEFFSPTVKIRVVRISILNFLFVFFCSTTSDYVLRALPTLSADYQAQADKLFSAFTGDPSFFAFNGEETEPEPEDPEAPPVERFRELHRLSSTVKVLFDLILRIIFIQSISSYFLWFWSLPRPENR